MQANTKLNLRNSLISVLLVMGLLALRLFARSVFDYAVIAALGLLSLLMIWHNHSL